MSEYPEAKAVETWTRDGITYSIVPHDSGYFCGYARFPKRPVKVHGHNGILRYVPVHGGITYADSDAAGMVYGFDCAHVDDDRNPRLKEMGWLRAECERLAAMILLAAHYEDEYLIYGEGNDNDGKARLLDGYRATCRERFGANEGFNFGLVIAAMGGRL